MLNYVVKLDTSKPSELVPDPQGQEERGSLGFSKRSGN